MDYNFEEGVDKLLHSQRKTKKSLYDTLGLSRQGFDSKLKNKTLFVTELATMASFFEMSQIDLFANLSNISTISENETDKYDNYLKQHLIGLEEKFNSLVNQLAVKDRQIDGLQRTVDVLVGKFEGIPFEGRVLPMYPGQELEEAV